MDLVNYISVKLEGKGDGEQASGCLWVGGEGQKGREGVVAIK